MRQPSEYIAIHKSADYFEPLLRGRIVRAMQALRRSITVEDIARAIRMRNPQLVQRSTIEATLKPAVKVVRDAVRRGGRLGAERIRNLR